MVKLLGFVSRSCHKYHFCRDKTFVTTKHVFVETIVWTCISENSAYGEAVRVRLEMNQWRELPQVSFLSRQTRVCRDKSMLVATKMILVATPASDRDKALSKRS